jgi:4-hydroxybenzoate polyprenyltransferase
VAGITVVSRSETSGGSGRSLGAGVALQDLALVGLAGVALGHQRFPYPDSDRPLIPLEGLLVLALVALAVNTSATRAIREPIPAQIQKTVKTGILSLVWLHVGLVAAVRGLEPAVVLALVWFPAFILGRWLYST